MTERAHDAGGKVAVIGDLRGDCSLVAEQIAIERAAAALAKEKA